MRELPESRVGIRFRAAHQTAISQLLLGTGFVGTAFAVLYPILKFITPPHLIEAAQNSVTAGKVSDLALNSGKIFKFGNKPGLLIRTASGDFKAFSAICTHLDCIVQYQPEKQTDLVRLS
jgi:Rieske Fe-S protein